MLALFLGNRMRGDMMKIVSLEVREKTLKGAKSQESCVLNLV